MQNEGFQILWLKLPMTSLTALEGKSFHWGNVRKNKGGGAGGRNGEEEASFSFFWRKWDLDLAINIFFTLALQQGLCSEDKFKFFFPPFYPTTLYSVQIRKRSKAG